MPESFQSTSHKEANYNRPDQVWTCGGEHHDCPCYLGPDRRGRCRAGKELDGRTSGQCLPRKIGSRWLCTREETHSAPPCEEGPLPDGSCCKTVARCRPVRSLRSRRKTLTIAVSAMTVAVLIIAYTTSPRDDGEAPSVLSAGHLSSNHSFLQTKCSECHSNEPLTPARISALHSVTAQHRAISDGRLCLECHDTIGGTDGQFAFHPHTSDMTRTTPGKRGQSKSSDLVMIAASALGAGRAENNSIHCATCHKEHHGAGSKITELSDRQCQTCHENQFKSFSDGHPEFRESIYPYKRRNAIRFDHYSHYQKHFHSTLEDHPGRVPEGYNPNARHMESVSCNSCHAPDPSGENMTVKPFEVSCAQCHEESTRGGEPFPFLAFPALNTGLLDNKLRNQKSPRSLGTWIEDSPNTIPWPTLQLLPEDAREAWKRLRSNNIQPFDSSLPDLDDKSVDDLERLAWAIKSLARDLSQNNPQANPSNKIGHEELSRRLQETGFDEPEKLIAGLPASLVDTMRRGFSEQDYIRLLKEVDAYRGGSPPAPVDPETPEKTQAAEGSPDTSSGEGKEDTGENFGEDTGESFGEDTGESFGEDTGESFGEDPDEPSEEAEKPGTASGELSPIDPETWASQGGWFQQFGVVSYRSRGHADPLIRDWLDALVSRVDDPLARAQLADGFDFRRGSAASTTGQCFKCHSVDETRDQNNNLVGARINWHSITELRPHGSLTRYKHSTHLLLTDCRSCHSTRQNAAPDAYLQAFPGENDWDHSANWSKKANPGTFQSNFSIIRKNDCAQCHNPFKAGELCTQCHKYHRPREQSGFLGR